MLGKLFKYDFKAMGRVLWPLQIGVAGSSVLATFCLAFIVRSSNHLVKTGTLGNLLTGASITLLVILGIAIYATLFVSIFLILQRFYKNLLSDEGYLSFTLPVSVDAHLWSKLFSAVLWSVISGAVILLGVGILVVFGTATGNSVVNPDVFTTIGEMFKLLSAYWTPQLSLVCALIAILGAISLFTSFLNYFFCIVLGGMISKNHKILTAIGCFLGLSIVVGIISSIFTQLIPSFLSNWIWSLSSMSGIELLNAFVQTSIPMLLIYIVFELALGVAYYFISRHLLKNKLNLE